MFFYQVPPPPSETIPNLVDSMQSLLESAVNTANRYMNLGWTPRIILSDTVYRNGKFIHVLNATVDGGNIYVNPFWFLSVVLTYCGDDSSCLWVFTLATVAHEMRHLIQDLRYYSLNPKAFEDDADEEAMMVLVVTNTNPTDFMRIIANLSISCSVVDENATHPCAEERYNSLRHYFREAYREIYGFYPLVKN